MIIEHGFFEDIVNKARSFIDEKIKQREEETRRKTINDAIKKKEEKLKVVENKLKKDNDLLKNWKTPQFCSEDKNIDNKCLISKNYLLNKIFVRKINIKKGGT